MIVNSEAASRLANELGERVSDVTQAHLWHFHPLDMLSYMCEDFTVRKISGWIWLGSKQGFAKTSQS